MVPLMGGLAAPWLDVRCLVNVAVGPAVKLNQDPHKSQLGLSQEKFEVWPQPTLVYCMG